LEREGDEGVAEGGVLPRGAEGVVVPQGEGTRDAGAEAGEEVAELVARMTTSPQRESA
jgi:hypothetical protein